MGSLVGAMLAIGQDSSQMEAGVREWRKRFPRTIEYRFWRMHLASVKGMTKFLRELYGDRLVNRTEIPFWANALDIEAAEEVALADGELVSALLATMALPTWLPPMRRDSRLLVDAALVDPVPARLTRRMHGDFIVAINAIGPSKSRALATRFPFRAYDFVSRCLRVVGHEIGRLRTDASADAVLVPDVGDTNMLSFDRSSEIIAAGEQEAEARLPAVMASYARLQRAAPSAGPATTA
jgi:NTE family protein